MAPFGSAIGLSPALLEAAQSRGINLQSPASASGGSPMPQPVSQLESAQAAIPQPTGVPVAPEAPATSAPEQPDSDARLALKALTKVVTDESSLKKDLVKARVGGMI